MRKLTLAFALLGFASFGWAADRVWTAGGGADNRWSVAANWQDNVVPVAGDTLVFPRLLPSGIEYSVNDLGGVEFTGIVRPYHASNNATHEISGQEVLLSGAIAVSGVQYNVQALRFQAPVRLTGTDQALNATAEFNGLVRFGGTHLRLTEDAALLGGLETPAGTTLVVEKSSHSTVSSASPFHGDIQVSPGGLRVSPAMLATSSGTVDITSGSLIVGDGADYPSEPIPGERIITKPVRLHSRASLDLVANEVHRVRGPIEFGSGYEINVRSHFVTHIESPITGTGSTLTLLSRFPYPRSYFVLSNPANAFSGVLQVDGAVALGAPEVIPDGVDLRGGLVMDRSGTETVRWFWCNGLLRITPGLAQLVVTEGVALNCRLEVIDVPGPLPDEVILIRNTSGVAAPFTGMDEGTSVQVAGQTRYITYRGGASGKDVALLSSPPPVPSSYITFEAYRGQPDARRQDVRATVLAATGGLYSRMANAGTLRFEMNGQAIPGCEAIAVQGYATAPCSVTFTRYGRHEITATYSGYYGATPATATHVRVLSRTLFDFNGSGTQGLLWQHTDGRVRMWDSLRIPRELQLLGAATGWTPTHVANFGGHVNHDIAWQHTDGRVSVWFMIGTSQQGGSALLGPGTGWSIRRTGDFNGDGTADILWERTDGSAALWLLNNNGVQSGGTGLFGAGTGWRAVHVDDFDADFKDDILWQRSDGTVALWLMDGATQKGGARLLDPGTGWTPLRVADFNGDGRADILWQHTDGRVSLWLMDGTRQVGGAALLPAGTGFAPQFTVDMDGDGRADILWQRTDGRSALWMMDGASLRSAYELRAPGNPWLAIRAGSFSPGEQGGVLWEHADGSTEVWSMYNGQRVSTRILTPPGTGWDVKP